MSKRDLTVGYLKELITDLPDDTAVCISDWDGSHLHCYLEQAMVDGRHLLIIPSTCYQLWLEGGWLGNEPYPIPIEWKESGK